ncbi:MAG: hypothetical protein ACTSSL_10590 [Candidatus Heimdallarchaeaceae archaeon]
MSQFVSPPAIIVYIYDLINGTLRTDPENPFQMAILTKNGELIERVRIVGTIVDKYHSEGIEGKKDYTMLSVDDGGKPRGNDEEIFILPEIPMKVENIDKEIYLRLVRAKRYTKKGMKIKEEKQTFEESEEQESLNKITAEVLILLQETDDALSMEEILDKIGEEREKVEKAIQTLIKNGDIYEPKKYYFKAI